MGRYFVQGHVAFIFSVGTLYLYRLAPAHTASKTPQQHIGPRNMLVPFNTYPQPNDTGATLAHGDVRSFSRQGGELQMEVAYLDYELYLSPIPLYDWDGQSGFDIDAAKSLLLWHSLHGVF